MKRIVIFASGSGTNAENIIKFFNHSKIAKVTTVLCNNEHAKVFDRCKKLNTKCLLFNREDFFKSEKVLDIVKENADYVILAGFLWKVPANLIENFSNKIINIHPALLPNYGGKGMYGMNVHKAVKENNEPVSGITIHFVNENYDEGAIIFQAKTSILKTDSPKDIANRIHILEQKYFPKVIEKVILEA